MLINADYNIDLCENLPAGRQVCDISRKNK
jgi:hypothetical protein